MLTANFADVTLPDTKPRSNQCQIQENEGIGSSSAPNLTRASSVVLDLPCWRQVLGSMVALNRMRGVGGRRRTAGSHCVGCDGGSWMRSKVIKMGRSMATK